MYHTVGDGIIVLHHLRGLVNIVDQRIVVGGIRVDRQSYWTIIHIQVGEVTITYKVGCEGSS